MGSFQSILQKIDRKAAAIGAAVFVAAFLFRLIGIGWGLPNETQFVSFHPDEPVNMAYSQQIDPLKGDLTPNFYNYGTLYLTLTHFAAKVGVAYFKGPEVQDPTMAAVAVERAQLLGARLLSALAGAGMAALAFLILYRRTHLLGAIVSGAVIALSPGLVVHSRFATVDVVATFFGLLSLYWAIRLVPLPEDEEELSDSLVTKFSLFSGIAAGLCAACKYNGILVLVALVAILFIQHKPKAVKSAAIAVAVSVVVFLIGVPGILLETASFMRDFQYELGHTASGHGTVFMATAPGFVFHLSNLGEALGIILTVAGLAGLARASWKKHAWAIGLLCFTVLFYLVIGQAEVKFLRYVFPLLPGLAIGAGWLVGQAHTHPNQAFKAVGFGVLLGLGGLPVGGAKAAAIDTGWMAGMDPRQQAAAWLKTNIKEGESVGLVKDPWFYTPPIYPLANGHPMMGWDNRWKALQESPIKVVRHMPANPDERFDWDQRLLTENKPTYLAISSFETDDYDRIVRAGPKDDLQKLFSDRFQSFSKLMNEEYEVAEVFGGGGSTVHDMMYIRPTLWIWRRKDSLKTNSTSSSTPSAPTAASATTP